MEINFENLAFLGDDLFKVKEELADVLEIKKHSYLLNISMIDQSVFSVDKNERLQTLVSYMDLLGGYLYKLLLARLFHENMELADYSTKKMEQLINYFDSINLPSLILAENGLHKALYCRFSKEDKDKKDNFIELQEALGKNLGRKNKDPLARPWFQVLFDSSVNIHDISMTDSSDRYSI